MREGVLAATGDARAVRKRRSGRLTLDLELPRCSGHPLAVPEAVLEYLAGQPGVRRQGAVRDYMMREMTRFEHRWEIRATDGWQEFAQVTAELTRRVDRRA